MRKAAVLFSIVIRIIDFFFTKERRIVIFASSGGKALTGNGLSLYNYLKNDPDFDCFYYVRQKDSEKAISYRSIKDIIIFLRARFVFITHGMKDFHPLNCSSRKIVINLFHGVPTKGMGLAQKFRTKSSLQNARNAHRFDFFLSSSKISAHNINYCLEGDKLTYLLCGQPRNDRFFNINSDQKPPDFIKKGYDSIFLYAPTWREYEKTNHFPFKDYDNEEINSILNRKNALLYLRPHINEMGDIRYLVHSNIKLLTFEDCPDVYDLLPFIDCLITDYSSIYNDYLLLNKPIIFIQKDIEKYCEYNSILIDDFVFWYPGIKPFDFDSYKEALIKILENGNDGYDEHRKKVNKLLHTYEHGDSCLKLTRFIKQNKLPGNCREILL